jgi:hypothetical protein
VPKRRFPWRLVFTLAGVALAIYLTVETIIAGIGTPPLPVDQNGISLKGGQVRGNRITTRSWSFDYTSAELSPDGTSGTVNGVKNGVVFKHGKPYLHVTAASITLDTMSLNFTAVGKVTLGLIDDPLKRSFDTDLVVWNNATKQLEMDHESYLHAGEQVLAFKSIDIDFTSDKVHFGAINGSTLVKPLAR